MKIAVPCFASLVSLLLLGCDSTFFDIAARSSNEPQIEAPVVSSFDSLQGITITWSDDPLADSYILYKKQLPAGPLLSIYSGTNVGFFDTSVTSRALYQYSLSKVRGTKEFLGKDLVTGAYDDVSLKDPNGNNDTRENAQVFGEYQISDTVVYFWDVGGIILEDRDWYYSDLPARRQMEIQLTYNSAGFDLTIDTDSSAPISNGAKFFIKNGANGTKRVFFSVRANVSVLSQGATFLKAYALDFVSLQIYNPVQ